MRIRFDALLFLSFLTLVSLFSGSCKGPKLAEADAQFDRGEYFNASKTYKAVYNKLHPKNDRETRARVAYQLANCYRRLNMAPNASAAYQNAIRYEYPDSTAFYWLGRSLQAEGKYQPAIDAYSKFLEWSPDDALAKEGIRGCRMAIRAKEGKRSRYIVKSAKLFNSRRSDFSPMYLDKDLNTIYFTSSTEKATGTNRSEITGTKKSDIFFSKKDENGRWGRPEPAEGSLNTEHDEGIVSFSPDGQTMYLTVARRAPEADTSVEIYTSQRSDASWSEPQKFEITADTLSAYGHPAVSPDGIYLYFSSDMPGGYGGKDIWRINLKERSGSLENLGPQINTAGDEMFPYLRNDTTLYFSSDGHPGFGGLDLFIARQNSTRDRWSIENMGLPMNSPGDDFGITFGTGESGFYSSNRGDA
ncbi:MAG: tetratricopeptide repeat protein, partial [Muribaculaceae bacterium]|nr:tetratricopeptide repeat protein [Muribaculaceae bacterium]